METAILNKKSSAPAFEPLQENQFIQKLGNSFSRHPDQINNMLHADAEIICLDEANKTYLVGKIDGIHEEINCGLYTDPFMIGWMSVTATLSDLAAVGATPTGLLLLLQLTSRITETYLQHITLGIETACRKYGTFILGGDTNISTHLSIAISAIGSINGHKPMMRTGCRTGDVLYTTGKPGAGTQYAYDVIFRNQTNTDFQPSARLWECLIIRDYASACIDSSDGFIPALANLSEINNVGFSIERPMHELICEKAYRTSEKAGIPPWLMLSGPHGDYELLFTVPAEKNEEFLQTCFKNHWQPEYVGTTTDTLYLQLQHHHKSICFSPAKVANLFAENQGNIPAYFKALLKLHYSLTEKTLSNVTNHG